MDAVPQPTLWQTATTAVVTSARRTWASLRHAYEWLGDNQPEILGFIGLAIMAGMVIGAMVFLYAFLDLWGRLH